MTITLTEDSMALFLAYAKDAGNWSGTPLVGGNVRQTQQHNGNLTHLKKAGLVTTFTDEGNCWLSFEDSGKSLAADHGITITD